MGPFTIGSIPACERLKMTITLIDNTRGQALHTLKTMWALCEVAKEEKIWSPEFDSFDQFKSTLHGRKTWDMPEPRG